VRIASGWDTTFQIVKFKFILTDSKKEITMLVYVGLIIFIIISIVLGTIYNKIVIKKFSDKNRKLFGILTMVFFLGTSIFISVVIGITSYINSTINNYSGKIAQYIYNAYPDNEFVMNGIDLDKINDGASQINKAVSDLKAVIPSHDELSIDKRIYDMVVNNAMDRLQNQLSTVNNTVSTHAKKAFVFVDKNNSITVSSIFNYLTSMAIARVKIISLGIMIALIIPIFIYIVSTSIAVLVIVKKRKSNTGA
jgi:hypothetical protein